MVKNASRRTFVVALCSAALACGLAAAPVAFAAGTASGGDKAQEAQASETREFTDSLGRTVEIPAEIEAIAPSGYLAQQVLMTVAPEKMVCLASSLTDSQAHFFGEEYAGLTEVGAIFGSKGDFNREEVAASGAQIVIDVGEVKDGMADDLDALQEQLGIPCVHISSSLDTYGDCYRTLGELLGVEDRANEIADYCDASYKEVSEVMANIPEEERTDVLYLTGDDGLSCLANGSYQANVIDMVADNVAVVDDPSGKSNETDMEQIANWNPQVIIFAPKSAYELAGTDATWQGLTAIETGNYCEVPSEPFNWLNGPPSVNQVLGMQWLARVLYPEMFDDDMYETVAAYYKTMYQYDLSEDEFNEIAKNASLVCEQELAE